MDDWQALPDAADPDRHYMCLLLSEPIEVLFTHNGDGKLTEKQKTEGFTLTYANHWLPQ